MSSPRLLMDKENSYKLVPDVIFDCGSTCVTGIARIPDADLLAVSTNSEQIFLFEDGMKSDAVRIFDKHEMFVCGLIHVSGDILASVDGNGTLLTWEASTGKLLGTLKASETVCTAVAKAGESRIIIGTKDGNIIIVDHTNGKNLIVEERYTFESKTSIYAISSHDDLFVAAGAHEGRVWNYSRKDPVVRNTIEHVQFTHTKLSKGFIVMVAQDGKIYVNENRPGYRPLQLIDLKKIDPNTPEVYNISFLRNDIVIVTSVSGGIFVVSLMSGACLFRCELETPFNIFEVTFLSDMRVCVGGHDGYCAKFTLPRTISASLAERSYQGKHPELCEQVELQHANEVLAAELKGMKSVLSVMAQTAIAHHHRRE